MVITGLCAPTQGGGKEQYAPLQGEPPEAHEVLAGGGNGW